MEPRPTNRPNGIFTCLFIFQLIFVLAFTTSCNQAEKKKRQKDLDDFKTYVQAHRDSIDVYATQKWDELNRGFDEKKAELEKDTAKMDEIARESYNQTVNDWNQFKTDYTRKNEELAKVADMDKLRATLVIDGVRPDYTDLTAKDVVNEYEHFVNTVSANKDVYTKEQWMAVNVNYQALNGRKRELEKNLTAKDLATITKLQLQYTGIKAVNRPFAANP